MFFVTPLLQQHDVSQSPYEAVSKAACSIVNNIVHASDRLTWLSDSGASAVPRHHGHFIRKLRVAPPPVQM
jgi:hypothetical protein